MAVANVWQRLAAFVLDYLIIAAYLILLVMVSMLMSRKHQAFYDWIAGTYVIIVLHPARTQASEKHAG
jgi:uncharacterized RDD family membrane protein YckC